jgi:transcriptional regulator with XRE-family HTH domain
MESGKVGAFLAQLRKEKELTQQGLADTLGVTNKAVSKWETGDGYPEITIVPALADALGVTADELLRGERATKGSAEPNLPRTENTVSATGLGSDARIALEAAWLKFRNMNLICLGTAILGFITFWLLLVAGVNGWISMGVMMSFLLFSVILFSMQFNTFKTSVSQFPTPEPAEGYVRPMAYAAKKARLLIYLWLFPFFIGLIYNLFIAVNFAYYGEGGLYFDPGGISIFLLIALVLAGAVSYVISRAVVRKIDPDE